MITNLVDKAFYITGLISVGCLAFFWNKKITWYDVNNNSENYRKIIFFKYGIFPDQVVYQKSKNTSDWKIISEKEYENDKNAPNFNFKDFSIDINLLSNTSTSNYTNFYKKL